MLSAGALSGITVIDLSRLLPGPYCSMILADHGARVIAVEDKKFKADGLFIDTVYRNKSHISLDLKTKAGKDIFMRLAKNADVILEGFRPGVVKRLGVDYDSIRRINSRIIYCSVTGYGQTGDYKDRAGHDVNYMGLSGVLDLIGEHKRPPVIPGVQIADIMGGGMNAAIGILLALFVRERSGQGQYIDISMIDGIMGLLSIPLFFYQLTGKAQERSNSLLSNRYACYHIYETADSKFLTIGALEHRFWKNLCELLEIPEFIPLQYDETRRKEIIAWFQERIKTQTLAEWSEFFHNADVCWGPVKDITQVLSDTHIRERNMFVEAKTADGRTTRMIGVPVKLSDTPGTVRTPPPVFGENSRDILSELGYSAEEIEFLAQQGVI